MRIPLTPAERSALRARAHHLAPVVMIGNDGLTPAVLHEIDVNLLAHGLIKIRVFADERTAREDLLAQIADELDASPVQHIGKLLVLYRPVPENEKPAVKKPAAKRGNARAGRSRGAEPMSRTAAKRTPGRRPESPTGTAPKSPAGRGIPGRRRRPPQP